MAITHPTHPAVIVEDRCNALMWNCKGHDEDGNECDHHYENNTDTHCPQCSTVRRRCLNYPEKGREACRYHGGRALRGAANPNYEGKGFSKFLPTRMLEYLNTALTNPDILNLSSDIALLEARQAELAQRLKDKEWGPGLWKELVKTFDKFDRERRKARNAQANSTRQRAIRQMDEHINDLGEIILHASLYDEKLWDEIRDIQNAKVRLVKTEMQRRKQAQEVVSAEEFRTLLGYIINSIQTRVSNPDEAMAVLSDIQRLNI